MKTGLVLESLTVEGLRGFNQPQTIDFRGRHALISGKMGTGKSSTLCAIEWGIFGDIAYIKCSESKTQAEFVNANRIDQKARVTLKFKGNDGEYVIQREKHARKRDSYLTLSTPHGDFEDDDAADEIFPYFGTFDDFHRSVFLHQEAVRAILTENPEERDSALDRLFGLERTRELMAAIPITTVRKEYENLESEKNKIEERIKGAVQQAEVEIRKAREEASELGLQEDDLNLEACIARFKQLSENIRNAADDCGVEKPAFIEPVNEDDVSRALKKVKEVIKSCRMQIAATSKISELQKSIKQIGSAKVDLEDTSRKLEDVTQEYRRMEKEWGTIESIAEEEEHLREEEEKLKKERASVDSTHRLVADAMDVLSEQQPGKCPVCGARISSEEVLSELKTKVSVALKERLSEIESKRKEVRELLLQLSDRKKEISKAITNVAEAQRKKDEAAASLKKILQSKSTISDDLLKEAGARLSELNEELNKAEEALTEKNRMLEGIEDSADKCRAIVRVLDKEAEYERIKETFATENSQIETLKVQITQMSALHSRLQRISDAITAAQIGLAQEFVGRGAERISDYYGRLCGHPYYNSIKIDIEQRNVKGVQKNTYNIKAFNSREGKETLISTRFSTGQMNCAALSVFLSLSSMLDRRIGFMILDDPSQSLDREHKKFLVSVLNDVSTKSQVIIATQDDELEQEIQVHFAPQGGYNFLKYEGWGKEGPVIKVLKS